MCRKPNSNSSTCWSMTSAAFYFQPCFSVVWDTGIAAYALGESGLVPDHSMARAVDWLLTKEVRRRGDWSVKRPNVEPPAGFRIRKRILPDIDACGATGARASV